MIRVLVVDDSEVSRQMISGIINSEPDISVIATAKDGIEAIDKVTRYKPDIVTMDINMPGMNGFETISRIMEENPLPIIIISGIDNLEEIAASFQAVKKGALTVLPKPPSPDNPSFESFSNMIISSIRIYSEIKVVKRRKKRDSPRDLDNKDLQVKGEKGNIKLVVIGASTGGPPVIQTILELLSKNAPFPLLLVQHMSSGFINGFASWLHDTTGFRVIIPREGEILLPGILYIAPEDVHIGVTRNLSVHFSHDPPEHNIRPSISYLFRSSMQSLGSGVVGILLSGMGMDGASELSHMKEIGCHTIVQDKESSVVYGMPGSALLSGLPHLIMTPEEIAGELNRIAYLQE